MADDQNIRDRLGAGQEQQVEQGREAKEYDAELGERVARDAQRLVAGIISEAEFYRKYHQAYLKEFGVDDRPISPAENVEGTPQAPVFSKQVSRRTLLKLAGAGGVALTLTQLWKWVPGASASPGLQGGDNQPQGTRPVQYGMVIDLERCDDCLACVDACQAHNNLSPGANWMYVFAYRDENQDGLNFLVRPCQHCSNSPCVKVCPVRARHKRERDGLVLTNYDICIGCRYCQVACPYGVNYFQWGKPKPEEGFRYPRRAKEGIPVTGNPPKGVMGKCTFCPEWQDDEATKGTTVCQLACPHDVIHFGDMNDPNSVPREYLRRKALRKRENGQISTFRLLEKQGTKPNVIYIGHQPTSSAKPVDNPVRYEDYGLVEGRQAVLEGPRPWFMGMFGGRK